MRFSTNIRLNYEGLLEFDKERICFVASFSLIKTHIVSLLFFVRTSLVAFLCGFLSGITKGDRSTFAKGDTSKVELHILRRRKRR